MPITVKGSAGGTRNGTTVNVEKQYLTRTVTSVKEAEVKISTSLKVGGESWIRRRWWVVPVVTFFLACGGIWYDHVYMGVPFLDEWVCETGETPVLIDVGGSHCAENGSTLKPGERWDPLGNRPYVCEGRRGWAVVYNKSGRACLREGLEIPDGWRSTPVRRG
jgi:hypothetical protein